MNRAADMVMLLTATSLTSYSSVCINVTCYNRLKLNGFDITTIHACRRI